MTSPRVLLIGGHGKVALYMTPLMLARSWHVTSLIRDPSHKDEILKLGEGHEGKVEVLVSSLEDVKSNGDAKKVLELVKPNYVVWSAGAGGKGGYQRTYAVDQDAAKHYISSAVGTPSVTKFLMVSYIGSRRNRAPWWSDLDWASAQRTNTEILPHYHQAKVEADEYLTAVAKRRVDRGDSDFRCIILRPGSLTDVEAQGKVRLGKTSSSGSIPRADVAAVAVELLERDNAQGWYDLLEGNDAIVKAVDQVIEDGVNCIEGEDLDAIHAKT